MEEDRSIGSRAPTNDVLEPLIWLAASQSWGFWRRGREITEVKIDGSELREREREREKPGEREVGRREGWERGGEIEKPEKIRERDEEKFSNLI